MTGGIEAWLQTAVAGAIGGSAALIMKELVLPISIEVWKRDQALRELYKKFKEPLTLSAIELALRLHEIDGILRDDRQVPFLQRTLSQLGSESIKSNTTEDGHFQDYKLTSTHYRLCSFLAWLELYRQELTFLNSGDSEINEQLNRIFHEIRSALSDGHINRATDWQSWTDELIFREEARAIGETLISDQQPRTVIGYGRFMAMLCSNEWIQRVDKFFYRIGNDPRDFRVTRLRLLLLSLLELIDVVAPNTMPQCLTDCRPRLGVREDILETQPAAMSILEDRMLKRVVGSSEKGGMR